MYLEQNKWLMCADMLFVSQQDFQSHSQVSWVGNETMREHNMMMVG